MTVDEVPSVLARHHDALCALGVRSLRVFGSVARGEANAGSDVDLLVDLAPELDLFDFIDVKLYLEEALGTPVDLVEQRALRGPMLGRVLREAVDAA